MEVLVYDLGHDVQPAGGGVDVEQKGLGNAQENHETHQVEPEIPHHRNRARSNEFFVRHDGFAQIHHRAQDQGCINRLDTEITAEQQQGEHNENHIEDGDHQ